MLRFELCPFNCFFKNFVCQNLNFHVTFGFKQVLKLISNLDIGKLFLKKQTFVNFTITSCLINSLLKYVF